MSAAIDISEQEAELYDRQIRLWGLEAQRRLRNARLLLIGVNQLSAEIAKNLVLAGVHSLTLVDDAALTIEEAERSFVFDTDAVGQSRANAALSLVQAFNSMVHVTASSMRVSEVNEEQLQSVDAVLAVGQPVSELLRLDSLCRELNKKFFASDCYGYYGFVFVDLLKHEYVVERQPSNSKQDSTDQQQQQQEPELLKKRVEYPSLDTVLHMRWDPKQLGSLRRLPPALFLTFLIFEFQLLHHRRPTEADVEELQSLWRLFAEQRQLPVNSLDEAALACGMHGQFCPIAAIVGAMAAQELIKAVSCKDDPFENFFVFDGIQSCGSVQSLCMPRVAN